MTLQTKTLGISALPAMTFLGGERAKRNPIEEYQDYRFRAEIDWIGVKIRTLKSTNFQTVRNRLEAPYVETFDEGSGGAASEFHIKFYSPKNWQEIDRALERLTHDHPLAGPAEVTGIEIAFDAYSKRNDRKELAKMTSKFYRSLTRPVSENQRITPGKRGSVAAIPSPKILDRYVESGENIYIGNRDVPKENVDDPNGWMMQHIYLKETDKKEALPIVEQRARIEITLRGIALPHQLLDEWKSHLFTKESEYFKFRKPKKDLRWHQKTVIEHLSQYGSRRKKRSGDRRTIYSSATLADKVLNGKAYDALRNLTNRLKGGR